LSVHPSGDRLEVLLFEVAGSRFALRANEVSEILRAVALQSLPAAPNVISGVINLRGQAVPVLSMRFRFGLEQKALSPHDYFIVANVGTRRVALHVDRPLDLTQVSVTPLSEQQHLSHQLPYVAGVAPVDDGIVLIHDLVSFLSSAEALQLGAALESAADLERSA
jgi:purine-binding chemotaxis protein CheW